MPAQALTVPTSETYPTASVPDAGAMDSVLGTIRSLLKGERETGVQVTPFLDEGRLLFSSASLHHSMMTLGQSGTGKSATIPSLLVAADRRATKLVALCGDDELLAELDGLAPADWTQTWQSWFPAYVHEMCPVVEIAEQSHEGMLLSVEIPWTRGELRERLAERFPHLKVQVWLSPGSCIIA